MKSKSPVLAYFKVYFSFVILIIFSLFFIPKGDEILWVYRKSNSYIYFIFFYLNKLGEWVSILLLSLYIILKRKEIFIHFTVGYLLQMTLSTLLKKIFHLPRPIAYFSNFEFSLPSYLPILTSNSFPSGHTTTAFYLSSFIVFFLIKSKHKALFYLSLAICVGFARIILIAHFKEDVLAGSLLGVFSSSVVYYLYLNQKFKLIK